MEKRKFPRHVTSKWAKTQVLLKSRMLRSYIPETRTMSRQTLQEMLQAYGMVYVKPNSGTYGIGVMKVERGDEHGSSGYAFHVGTKVRTFGGYDEMYDAIAKLVKSRFYLAQKGIHLLKYGERRFDLRVMVQKNTSGCWECTGVIGRVAAAGKAVTNVHNGGTLVSAEKLLSGHTSARGRNALLKRLRRLGLSAAKRLHVRYPGIKEIGLDVAIDGRLHPWILEVNTRPDPFIFRKLKDRRIFYRIYRYAKAYGRL
ncbi:MULTISPECIES: YheC/YheD family protein [Paenibacillus]|uniref:YheC/YheD family protein n=1 Tax=Paenibacillus TaxID=44249 RepID=UPI0022B860EC|nr:YheC/YheD family protein [Paenibacillus caseinilyticus]MCZ8522838.1 YheC/YheD family protein [Paenibacillus caseinilyticus]